MKNNEKGIPLSELPVVQASKVKAYAPDILQESWEPDYSSIVLDKAYPVVMANSLIKARQPMRIREQKIFRLLISQVQPDTEEFRTFQIPLQLLAQVLNISSVASLKRDIYKITESLSMQLLAVHVQSNEKERDGWRMMPIMEMAEYDGHYLRLKLSSTMYPYLTKLKGDFTTYPITTITNFTSAYAMRIYEMLLMVFNKYMRKKTIFKVSVDKLRDILRDPQEIQPKYPYYANFKARVLKPAVEQINNNLLTEFTVTFAELKDSGKCVSTLQFVLKERAYFNDISQATVEEYQALKKAMLLDKTLTAANKSKVVRDKNNELFIGDTMDVNTEDLFNNKDPMTVQMLKKVTQDVENCTEVDVAEYVNNVLKSDVDMLDRDSLNDIMLMTKAGPATLKPESDVTKYVVAADQTDDEKTTDVNVDDIMNTDQLSLL